MKKTMQDDQPELDVSRRRLMQAMLVLPAALVASDGRGFSAALMQAATSGVLRARLEPTPACGDDEDDPTPAQTEGPFFKPSSPERTSLVEPGLNGTRLLLTGQVVSTSCAPIAGALLDFWQADDGGVYDNAGFKLRGHQFTDRSGRFTLDTIVPGLYAGRTRHIHVKVQARNGRVLTTQLYFPGETQNGRDGLFSPKLVAKVIDGPNGRKGAFNFVLA